MGGIFYEHLPPARREHRRIPDRRAGDLARGAAEPRRWVRRLGYVALGAVITQGILGGITVLWYLPDAISIAHASLAQIVFCLTTTIALVTSAGMEAGLRSTSNAQRPTPQGDLTLERLAVVTTVVIYAQIVIGATMRHTGAGLAIPDFPLAFGHLVPPHWDPKIAIHFAHRVGAATVTLLILATDRATSSITTAAALSCGVRRCCCSCCSSCRSRWAR